MEIKSTIGTKIKSTKRKKDLKLPVSIFIRATFAALLAIVSVCNGDACSSLKKQNWDPNPAIHSLNKRPLPARFVLIRDEGKTTCYDQNSCLKVVKSMQYRSEPDAIDCSFIIDALGNIFEERGYTYVSDSFYYDVVICIIKPNKEPYPNLAQKTSITNLLQCGKDQRKLRSEFFTNTQRSLHNTDNPEMSLQLFVEEQYGCPEGQYGKDCDERCSPLCKSCRGPSGRECLNGCKKPGFTPPKCRKPCLRGTWGDNCLHTCSVGCIQQSCSPFEGDCKKCIPGYLGPRCTQREPGVSTPPPPPGPPPEAPPGPSASAGHGISVPTPAGQIIPDGFKFKTSVAGQLTLPSLCAMCSLVFLSTFSILYFI